MLATSTLLRKYFLHLGGITAASLDTTKMVLEKRERLQFYLEHLRQKIDNGMEKLKNIESMTIDVMRLQVTALICPIVIVHSVAARGRHLSVNYPISISPNCPTLVWHNSIKTDQSVTLLINPWPLPLPCQASFCSCLSC